MKTLYDSDSFAVVHLPSDVEHLEQLEERKEKIEHPKLVRHGFEIVDKRSGKEVYLDGMWAELFQKRIIAWQEKTPTQEEVEDTLAGYAELAHTPISLH